MVAQHLVVGVAGALVILLAVAGLMEIDARAGPYETRLETADVAVTIDGHYQATGPQGTTGPGGVCVPDAPGGECTPARLDVQLRIDGLPTMTPAAHYVGFLTGPGLPALVLGTVTDDGARHALDVQEDRDARDYETLVVTLEQDAAATEPGPMHVYAAGVADRGQDSPYDLPADATASLVTGTGFVRATEIGGFSISTTAVGELTLQSAQPGWELHAWFTPSNPGHDPVHLGVWTFSDDDATQASLDARVERIRLEDQAAFVTTLVPAGATVGAAVDGFPVFTAPMAD